MTIRSHLLSRHLDINLHKVWVDEDESVATFPLWNLSGQLCGYQAYRPGADKVQKNDVHGRYYTFRGDKLVTKRNKTVTVWGLESWNLSNELYITEGIFDAARFTQLGKASIALLSNDPDISTKNWLVQVRTMRPVIAICDAGAPGVKMKKLGHTSYTFERGDAGDSSEEEIRSILWT